MHRQMRRQRSRRAAEYRRAERNAGSLPGRGNAPPGNRLRRIGPLLAILPALLCVSCSSMPLLDPKGPVGLDARFIIIASTVLMLIVVIPVIVMVIVFPQRYRAANRNTDYDPDWSHSRLIEWTVWLVPAVIVVILSVLVATYTYRMDPFQPLPGESAPLRIEVVSLDWKWLFIYPEQNIAAVNRLVVPANTPLSFRITSATVMTSFFIPRLGSQIYAMAGMASRLHLLALEEGRYDGQNQQFSGRYYADMRFRTDAVSRDAFDAWVQAARQSGGQLDAAAYERLSAPSGRYPVTLFSGVSAGLFDRILQRFRTETAGTHGEADASVMAEPSDYTARPSHADKEG